MVYIRDGKIDYHYYIPMISRIYIPDLYIYITNRNHGIYIIGIINGFTLWLSNIAMEAMAHENG